MAKSVETMLDEEIKRTLSDISMAVEGSDEAKWQLQKLSELQKQQREIERVNAENQMREKEISIKQAQIKEGKKDRVAKIILDGLAIGVPAGLGCYWMAATMKFSETGVADSKIVDWVSKNMKFFRK